MWQPVLMINGLIVFVLGLMMLVPAVVFKYYTGTYDFCFLESGLAAMFFGGALFLSTQSRMQSISILQGFLITVTSWFSASMVCAIPFYYHDEFNSFADALFEATSGVTATGSTIISDVEKMSKSILLWRAMLSGLGGIGIVIFAVALMPYMGIGGLRMFRSENSDTEEKFMPHFRDIFRDIIYIYILLNILCALAFKYAGMNGFDAICHALTTVSTGGFSTKNASIGAFQSFKIESIAILFMILGAMPLTYFILILQKRKFSEIVSNTQVNFMLKIILLYTLIGGGYYAYFGHKSFLESIRVVGFNSIAALTTTGLSADNFLAWGNWASIWLLFMAFHGGCTGSTTGSIKLFRWQVLFSFFQKNARTTLSPNQVVAMRAGGKIIDDDIASSVLVLILSFFLAWGFFSLLTTLAGVDFANAIAVSASSITNSGVNFIGSSYANFSEGVKYIQSFAMFLGRLEVITVLTLFSKIRL